MLVARVPLEKRPAKRRHHRQMRSQPAHGMRRQNQKCPNLKKLRKGEEEGGGGGGGRGGGGEEDFLEEPGINQKCPITRHD